MSVVTLDCAVIFLYIGAFTSSSSSPSDLLLNTAKISLFAGLPNAVPLIRGKITLVIFVKRGVCPSLLRGCFCADALNNREQSACAC